MGSNRKDSHEPIRDLQSLVFSSATDTVTLRKAKVYTGQYNGPEMIGFRDAQGIDYQLPLRDVEILVFTQAPVPLRQLLRPKAFLWARKL